MTQESEIPLRRFKTLLVVDLEATCWGEGRGPREEMETIEFGAVLVRMSDLRPIDERSWFIKPKLHPVLSEFCTELTSITQDQVDNADSFEKVCELIAEWLEPHRERLGWGSWGNYDKHQLQKDAARLGMRSPLEPYHHRNLKAAFSKQHELGKWRPGMRAALELCGLAIEGAHHRGIDDARNIARMLPFILDRKHKKAVEMNFMKRASRKRDHELAARGAVPPETFLLLRPDKIKDVRLEWPDVGLLDPEGGEDRNT